MLIRLALGPAGLGESDPAALVERLEAQSGVSAYLLRATLAGLTEPGRLLVALLAVFRHPVDLLDERLIEASMAVEGRYDVIAGIEELRRRQLVDHAARAVLHPLVHDHVYAGLARRYPAPAEPAPARGGALRARARRPAGGQLALRSRGRGRRGGRPARRQRARADRRRPLGRAADLAAELLGGGQPAEATIASCWSPGDLLVSTRARREARTPYRTRSPGRPRPPSGREWPGGWRSACCSALRCPRLSSSAAPPRPA